MNRCHLLMKKVNIMLLNRIIAQVFFLRKVYDTNNEKEYRGDWDAAM